MKAKKGLLATIPPQPPEPKVIQKASPKVPAKKPAVPVNLSGKATRTEIRKEAPRVSAPRASAKTAERGNQPRSSKPGKK